MRLAFSRSSPRVIALDGDHVLASFLQSSFTDAQSVEGTRRWLKANISVAAEDTYSFNGYALELTAGRVVIRSFYDQFPDTTYPYEEFVAALADYEAWLRRPAAEQG